VCHDSGHADHARSDYDLWLDRDAGVAVDAAAAGNEARFVNDYRGVRARPNAEFRECWDPRVGQKCMAVFVLPAGKKAMAAAAGAGEKGPKKGGAAAAAAAGIAKGEEICVSYGKGFWGKRQAEEEETEAVGEDKIQEDGQTALE
jgi:SET domain-containing protein